MNYGWMGFASVWLVFFACIGWMIRQGNKAKREYLRAIVEKQKSGK